MKSKIFFQLCNKKIGFMKGYINNLHVTMASYLELKNMLLVLVGTFINHFVGVTSIKQIDQSLSSDCCQSFKTG